MKSHSVSDRVIELFQILKVNRLKCRHLLSVGRISSMEGPSRQPKLTSVIIYACVTVCVCVFEL